MPWEISCTAWPAFPFPSRLSDLTVCSFPKTLLQPLLHPCTCCTGAHKHKRSLSLPVLPQMSPSQSVCRANRHCSSMFQNSPLSFPHKYCVFYFILVYCPWHKQYRGLGNGSVRKCLACKQEDVNPDAHRLGTLAHVIPTTGRQSQQCA